jgi:hypothetical protein
MAGKNGGARPGSGRKKTSDRNAGAVVKAEKQIRDRLPAVIDALLELALGVTVEETTDEVSEDGTPKVKVYRKPPDAKSAIYLTDRVMGKPTERVELDADVTANVALSHFESAIDKAYGNEDGDESESE